MAGMANGKRPENGTTFRYAPYVVRITKTGLKNSEAHPATRLLWDNSLNSPVSPHPFCLRSRHQGNRAEEALFEIGYVGIHEVERRNIGLHRSPVD